MFYVIFSNNEDQDQQTLHTLMKAGFFSLSYGSSLSAKVPRRLEVSSILVGWGMYLNGLKALHDKPKNLSVCKANSGHSPRPIRVFTKQGTS